MTAIENRTTVETQTMLTTQARQLAEHYPELYEHLRRRDRALERALARIPSRADVELASVFNARRYLEKTMKNLAPGVRDLNGVAISTPKTDEGLMEVETIDD
jgi:hypothetical protein